MLLTGRYIVHITMQLMYVLTEFVHSDLASASPVVPFLANSFRSGQRG